MATQDNDTLRNPLVDTTLPSLRLHAEPPLSKESVEKFAKTVQPTVITLNYIITEQKERIQIIEKEKQELQKQIVMFQTEKASRQRLSDANNELGRQLKVFSIGAGLSVILTFADIFMDFSSNELASLSFSQSCFFFGGIGLRVMTIIAISYCSIFAFLSSRNNKKRLNTILQEAISEQLEENPSSSL